jgi:hypothetical protein
VPACANEILLVQAMNKLISFAIPGLLLTFGLTASATTLTVDSTILSAGTAPDGGHGGEFEAYLNGNPLNVADVYCIDFADAFSMNHTYSVNLSTPLNLTNTHLGGYTGTWEYDNGVYSTAQRYDMAGYLSTLLNSSNSPGANDAIVEAMWTLLDANTSLSPYDCHSETSSVCQTAVSNDISAAFSNLSSFLSGHTITIYTDADSSCTASGNSGAAPTKHGCMQEFIAVSSSSPGNQSPVPEPSSFVLMGIGGALIGLGVLRQRKATRK